MNAVNVGLVTSIIQHNRTQGVFLLCKITNLLIYSKQFVIMLDDANRKQEQRTIGEIDKKLETNGIMAKHNMYSGEKDTCIWTSEEWKFLLTM